jgi:predicted DNA-binding transcriptional regulator AlpA
MKNPPEPLLTTQQAAHYLNITPAALDFWRTKRWMSGPRFVRIGKGIVRYLRSDLVDYIQSNRVKIVKGDGYAERNASLQAARAAR